MITMARLINNGPPLTPAWDKEASAPPSKTSVGPVGALISPRVPPNMPETIQTIAAPSKPAIAP